MQPAAEEGHFIFAFNPAHCLGHAIIGCLPMLLTVLGESLTSLHVLGLALFALAVFEPIFLAICVVGYTPTSRAELIQNLALAYIHLVALLMSLFNHRQTGSTTARVREPNPSIFIRLSTQPCCWICCLLVYLSRCFAYAPYLRSYWGLYLVALPV
ncbi:hypothetical protein OH492_20535 [Vibrio chagasii]|nr:hypothetical protein [Vibrio chagasii]